MKHTLERETGNTGSRWVSMHYLGREVVTWDEHEEKSATEPATEAERLCQVELRKWMAESNPQPLTAEEAQKIYSDYRKPCLDAFQDILDAERARQAEIAVLSLGGSRYA